MPDFLEYILAIHVGATAEEVGHPAVHAVFVSHRFSDKRVNLVAAELGDEVVVIVKTPGI